MDTLYQVMHSSKIFDNIPEQRYPLVLHCLGASRKTFAKDQTILNIGDKAQLAGIILSGLLEVSFFDENGNQNSVSFLSAGEVFGAERACSDCHSSPTQLRAVKDSEVMFLCFDNLLDIGDQVCPFGAQVTVNLLKIFASQNQFLNLKLRIIGQKYLRDKIKIYLQTFVPDKDNNIYLPYNRRALAEFLYVDRSALSRELSRMRDEGILDFSGQTIHLIDQNFLI